MALTWWALSERQHLAAVESLRFRMGLFLALTEGAPAEEAYSEVFYWKGAVTSRLRLRHSTADADEKTRAVREELQNVSRRLARLVISRAEPGRAETRRKEIQAWARRKDELEDALTRLSPEYKRERAAATVADLQACLPPGTALVDLIAYGHRRSADDLSVRREIHLSAFIVPRSGKVVRVDLGPTPPIETAIFGWRERPAAHGRALREKLWLPIEKHLGGAKTVLVSPEGPLSAVSFSALPGAKAGTFLVEEYAFVSVPVPQMLPALLKRPAAKGPASLLLVGGVDYGRPGRDMPVWPPLPGTSLEAASVKKKFLSARPGGHITELAGDRATKPAVRKEMARHSYLHLATHGFFASPVDRAIKGAPVEGRIAQRSLAGMYPLAQSGLALARANRPFVAGEEDGILTALEMAELPLPGCELAVLSACDTGLGKVVQGDGAQGLQRALQVAGARTTVCSLWSVSDAATGVLMERFYEGLWGKEKLSKAEALRQAQLYVLRHPEKVAARAAELRGALVKRGVGEADLDARGVGKKSVKLPPGVSRSPIEWWAPFVLSGDWR
jgi:CHAT domain-containing protein